MSDNVNALHDATVERFAALLTEALGRIGTWKERAEWLLARGVTVGKSLGPYLPLTETEEAEAQAIFNGLTRHDDPNALVRAIEHILRQRGVGASALPREPSEAAIEAAQRAWWNYAATGDGLERVEVAVRAAYAVDGVPAVDAGEPTLTEVLAELRKVIPEGVVREALADAARARAGEQP